MGATRCGARRILTSLLVVCGCAASVREAAAQVAVGAAVGLSTQPTGASDQPYLGPGFGGTSFSTVIFVDGPERSTVTVGGEMSLAADISGAQSQRSSEGIFSFQSEHHDTIYSALVKVHSRPPGRFNMAAGGGAGAAHRATTRTGTISRCCFQPVETPASQYVSNVVFALTGAVDGVIATGNRVGIVGLFRVYYLFDDDRLPDGVVRRGVSSVIFRYGAGVQVRF
jgi:hypothetical protein